MNIAYLGRFHLHLLADAEGKEYLAVSTESRPSGPLNLPYSQTVAPFSDLSAVEKHLIRDVNLLRRIVAPSTEQSPICKLLDPQTPES